MNYNYLATVERVVDGDTLDMLVDLGFDVSVRERFRVYGLNTPETHTTDAKEKAAGLAAKEFVTALLAKQPVPLAVTTHKDDKEKYGRYLADVAITVDENGKPCATSLAAYLIGKGHGKAYFGGKR